MRAAVVLSVLLAACGSSTHRSAAPTSNASAPAPITVTTVTATRPRFVPPEQIQSVPAPSGMSVPGAQWLRITRPDGAVQLAAVRRPAGDGQHPVVVYLHGSSGLAAVQLAWTERLVDAGFIVVAGCYLDASSHTSAWLRCDGVPDERQATDAQMRAGYDALLDTVAALPDGAPGKIGVVGVSQGGIVALTHGAPRVKAIVADSAYGNAGAAPVTEPVLLLGMTNDPNVSHAMVVAFEQSLRSAGKPVTAHYYDGTGHVVTLANPDATARAVEFLRRTIAR